jgi:hypothetical protein
VWFKGIKTKMQRLIVQRKIRAGEAFDNSAEEIFLDQVRDVCSAFSRANTAEAAARKLAVKTLWRSTGRPSEPSHITYSTLAWNTKFKTATGAALDSPPLPLEPLRALASLPSSYISLRC